ncbi:FAD-dependent oxidoreductase [Streptomyces mirabilis]|uniref:FAD-dependent oxidoreductase n=1 Tax=Streptomyces mirabilis TaxID=68239 RepID=UPI0021BE0CDC|nr:pyridine nucleotide-disulfide oxidoreductase [Streptomyces mirabilis]MCT9107570.1 pyridine nucleotide-disulfide oxidoreductase [Streptomyces mirabilis]
MSERPAPALGLRSTVVLGGSLAGMLAAQALSEFSHVTIVERDTLPSGPEPRKGLPQAQHVHQMWSGGAQALENLLPGTTDRLKASGARHLAVPSDMVALSSKGWFRRWAESHYMILCSRDLLDWTVRQQVLSSDRITLIERAEALGLEGTQDGVTGARIRCHDGEERILTADLVVDATGRASHTPEWFKPLGVSAPATRTVASGLVYASRMYSAPEGAREKFPVVNVQADPRGSGPGQAGVLVPIEGGRWLVTLSGTRGGEPTTSNDHFRDFALGLRDPVIGQLLAAAQPLADVVLTRTTANVRYYYEKVSDWPEGFVAIGDSVAAFNPIYGHGMSVAAQSAVELRRIVGRHGLGRLGLAADVQKAIGRTVTTAWDLATGQDIFYPGATTNGPTRKERLAAWYVDRLMYTATGNGRVARAVTDVTSLQRGIPVLLRPSILIAAARGPLKDQLTESPLTVAEWKAANG